MTFRASRLVLTLALGSALAGTAQAQTSRMHLGPRVSYQFDLEKLGVGAQFSALVAEYLEFYPSFDYFFVDGGSFWDLNADLKSRWGITKTAGQWNPAGEMARGDRKRQPD